MNVGEVEAWVDESIRQSKARGYHPGDFIRMRAADGGRSIQVIERLVQSGEVQSGFRRMKQIGLLEWSLDSSSTVRFASD